MDQSRVPGLAASGTLQRRPAWLGRQWRARQLFPDDTRQTARFIGLCFVLAIPFWIVDTIVDHVPNIPVQLPISSLEAVCPLIAAWILVQRRAGWEGVRHLSGGLRDHKQIRDKRWYIPAIFLMPAVMLISYGLQRILGTADDEVDYSLWGVVGLSIVFLLGAIGEEIGWTRYATVRMQRYRSALETGLLLGLVVAVWHIVPLLQAGRSPGWIAWQCITIVITRLLIVWLYNNTNSTSVTILFHAMGNVAVFLFPQYGSDYDPMVTGSVMAIFALAVIWLWGSATLAAFTAPSQALRHRPGVPDRVR